MADKTVYDLIKKQNGERFAQAVRKFDNGIFDVPNIVEKVRYAGRDARPLVGYLSSLKNIKVPDVENPGDPFELLASAGYTAVYADTLEKQNAIRPYFAPGEELCTFRDAQRYQKYYIVNLVRNDAATLRRVDFTSPLREDAYGTSVMSIQMLKQGGFISIKNRYNHAVESPDNTYFSNPDAIVPGLAAALRAHFGVDFSSVAGAIANGYVLLGEYICKYNYEKNNVYYGADFYACDGKVHPIDRRSQVIMDDVVFDLHLRRPIAPQSLPTSVFANVFADQIKDKTLHVSKTKSGATQISTDDGTWVDILDGKVVGARLPHVTEIADDFLPDNDSVEYLDLPAVRTIGDRFVSNNQVLRVLNAPSVRTIGDNFLYRNTCIEHINMPNVTDIGHGFIFFNTKIRELSLGNVRNIGNGFMSYNDAIEHISMPKLEHVGDSFYCMARQLKDVDLSMLRIAGKSFMLNNNALERLSVQNLEYLGDYALRNNKNLYWLFAPKLRYAGAYFLEANEALQKFCMPRLESLGLGALSKNTRIDKICLPYIKHIGDSALAKNDAMQRFLAKRACR